jgi:hypothetical protein
MFFICGTRLKSMSSARMRMTFGFLATMPSDSREEQDDPAMSRIRTMVVRTVRKIVFLIMKCFLETGRGHNAHTA